MRATAAALLALSLSAAVRAEDTAAPVVSHQAIKYTERGAKVVPVIATITDESKIFPQVFYRYGPGEFQKPLDMKPVKGQRGQWGANVPVKGDLCEYYIEVYDELGNGPGRAGDPDKPFRVDTSGQGGMMVAEAPAPAPAPKAAKKAEPPPPAAWAAAPAAAVAPPPPAPAPKKQASSGGGRVWTWVVGGVGVGALAGGAVAGMSMTKADDVYTKSLVTAPAADYNALKAQYDANKSLGTAATGLLIAGGALVATSIVLFFLEGN